MAATRKKDVKASPPRPEEARAIPGWVMPGLDYPTFRLVLLSKLMDRKSLRQLTEQGGCTYPEWRVVSRLGCTVGGATVGQLAEAAWVDRAEVSRAVASLERRGLASRLDNPQDRRAPIHFLTKAGLQLYRKILDMRVAFHKSLVDELTPAEAELFDTVLLKLARQVQALPVQGS